MNKQISKSVFIFSIALFFVFAILSCGNKNMELIAKKWKLEKIEMPGQDSMIAKMDSVSAAGAPSPAVLPVGENTITSDVTITYEIR